MSFLPKRNSFRRRLVAFIVDSIIAGLVITIPVSILFGVLGFSSMAGLSLEDMQNANPWQIIKVQIAQALVIYFIMFFYMGWFYKNKGAIPGKLLMKLQVINLKTGGRMGYGRTFFREIISKTLAGMCIAFGLGILFAGLSRGTITLSVIIGLIVSLFAFYYVVLAAIFRNDRRVLHDLIANTQVVYTGPEAEKGI